MKRDIERIREILVEIEAAEPGQDLRFEGDVDCHHIKLLQDAGYVIAEIYEDHEGVTAEVERMTSQGYDFLDSVRNDTTWNKVKQHVGNTVGSVSLSVMQEVAVAVTKKLLGIDL